jgi:hypothetical protein
MMQASGNTRRRDAQIYLVGEATEGNHGKASMLDLGQLVPLEVLLVGALARNRMRKTVR